MTYPRHVPAEDVVGRVFGPDTCGGLAVATAVVHTPDGKTRVICRPTSAAQAAERAVNREMGLKPTDVQPWMDVTTFKE